MADGADDRNAAGEDRPRHAFVVEAPQILQRTAAAADDQHVAFVAAVGGLDGAHDLHRRFRALHRGGVDDDRQRRIAPLQYLQNIVQRRAAGGGDHPDAFCRGGQRLLELLIEQPFGAQALFQLLELLLQQAVAGGLHALGDQLVVAARFIQRDAGAHQDLLAVLRPEGDAAVAVAEHRAAHLGAVVFQREIPVAGGGLGEVGDLGGEPNLPHFHFQQLANRLIEAAYGKMEGETGSDM